MKHQRCVHPGLGALLCAALALSVAPGARAKQDVFLDFEYWKDGRPAGWKISRPDWASRDTGAVSGKYALKLTVPRRQQCRLTSKSRCPLSANEECGFRIWARGDASLSVTIHFYDKLSKPVGKKSFPEVNVTSGRWHFLSYRAAPESPQTVRTAVELLAGKAEGAVTLDCITFRKAPKARWPFIQLLDNGGFEKVGTNGMPKGWTTGGPYHIKPELVSDGAPEGRHAMRLAALQGKAPLKGANGWFSVYRSQAVRVDASVTTRYEVRLQARSPKGGQPPQVRVYGYRSGRPIGYASRPRTMKRIHRSGPLTEWHEERYAFELRKDVTDVTVWIVAVHPEEYFWIDDVRFGFYEP